MAVFLYILCVNLDSIGVGISYGLRKIHISTGASIIIALFSVFYAAIALYTGTLLTHILPNWLGQTLGSVILLILGVSICLSAFRPSKPRPVKSSHSFVIRPLGITISIVRDPVACDFDGSRRIDPREALYLGLALSLDSIGVGIGAGLSGISTWFLPPFIGLFQFIFLSVGSLLGKRLRRIKTIPPQTWTILSGILLILLAVLRAFS